jgi:hypothetical protein
LRKKHIIGTFSYPREKEQIVELADTIAKREGLSFSEFIMKIIGDYVSVHAAGNPSYELTKWVEEPQFKADPAVREGNETWDKYLEQCDKNDLAQLMGTFKVRYDQAKKSWIDKR